MSFAASTGLSASGLVVGAVLAGGAGRRMGEGPPKPRRLLSGRPLIDHVVAAVRPQVSALAIATRDVAAYADLGCAVVADAVPMDSDGRPPGPLAGVLAALDWARSTHPDARWLLTVPADAPFLPRDLADRLIPTGAGLERNGALEFSPALGRRAEVAGATPTPRGEIPSPQPSPARGEGAKEDTDRSIPAPMRLIRPETGPVAAGLVAVARSGGREHYAVALWPVTAVDALRRAVLVDGVRSIGAHLRAVGYRTVDWPDRSDDPFFNVNTPADLARAEAMLRDRSR